ncbi:MAG TPA: ribosome maturation factor RimM [Anaerolineales bacterium]|nr:ribosome maturation factor RimM [Anaerolineales bacterium]
MTRRKASSPIDIRPGSPSPGEPVFLAVGKLGRPHGVGGEMLMEVLTDFPERLQPGVILYIGPQHKPLRLKSQRWHDRVMLVAFDGYSVREDAAQLRNQLVQVRADDRPPLPEGEYYHHQLLGLHVVDEADQLVGQLVEILETGANDVYVVRTPSGGQVLLPAIEAVVLDVDLGRGEMRVHLLPGLLP